MNPRTKTLFHFTKSLDVLLKILKEGFWPRYCLEDISWLGAGVSHLAWPMVSFCDIPILRLPEHTECYGSYGIGLCREDWQATGLNPLLYVSPDSMLIDHLREIVAEARTNPNRRSQTNVMMLLAHCKPLKGQMVVGGTTTTKDFYAECEWRFIPWVEAVGGGKYGFFLTQDQFMHQQVRHEADEERRKDRLLEFYPDEVRYLLVKTRTDLPMLMSFIDSGIASYGP